MRRMLSVAAVLLAAGVAAAQGGPEGTYTVKAASVGGPSSSASGWEGLPIRVFLALSTPRGRR